MCDPTKKYEFTIKEDDLEANLTYDYGRDVVNEEETGAIKLIKDDGEGGNLDGAEFELYKDGVRYPDDIKTYVTGKDGAAGEIFIDNLPWGTYYFVEIKAPEGYVQPKEGDEWAKTSSVTIDKKSTISTVPFHQIEQSNTPIYGTLKLKKIDENGDALKGAKFSLVKIVDGEEKKVKVTGSNGVYAYSKTAGLFPISDDLETDNNATLVVTGLPYGYYEVHETQAPEGYNELEGAIYGFNVSEKDEEKNVEIANTPVQAKLRFIKASITGARLDGAKFDLFRKSDNGWEPMGVMTSVDGVVFRDGLRPGEYYFEETESPTGYLINSKQYTFTVRDIDDGQFVTIDNPDDLIEEELLVLDPPMKGSVRLFKAIKGTDTGLKGAEFELYRSGENDPFLTGLESNDKGYVTVENLDWGTYFFKETKAPEGYILDDKTEYGFEINENNVSEVVTVNLKGEELRVDNTPILGEAELIKQDSVSDSPIEGAKFKLCYANGTTVEGYDLMSTGKDGVIRTSRDALKAGSYYFQEVEPAKGYKPNDTKYAFEINQANMDDYVKAGEDGIVLNTPIPGKAELYKYTKIDEENVKGIAGAQFKLYIKKTGFHPITPYEEYTDEVYTTKADGLIEVDGLKWGEYYFEEIAAPEGYILDEDVENRRHAFKIDAEKLDHTGEYKLSHENKPYKGSVGLIKKYAIGGVVQGPLPGARFSFYKVHDDTDDEPILNSATADGLYVTDENGSITARVR